MQRVYKANAVVLKRIAIGETDKVVTLLTREWGKLRAVAKGARRPTSRLAGTTELFCYSRVVLAVGQNLDVLSQAEARETFFGLRGDLMKIGYASYVTELAAAATPERQPNAAFFDLLLSSLYVIERCDRPDMGARMFELKGWRLLGYEPQLTHCVRDRAGLVGVGLGFSPARGGAVCRHCAPELPGTLPLSPEALALMRSVATSDPPAITRLAASDAVRQEAARHMIAFTRARVDAPLRSLEFLSEMAVGASP